MVGFNQNSTNGSLPTSPNGHRNGDSTTPGAEEIQRLMKDIAQLDLIYKKEFTRLLNEVNQLRKKNDDLEVQNTELEEAIEDQNVAIDNDAKKALEDEIALVNKWIDGLEAPNKKYSEKISDFEEEGNHHARGEEKKNCGATFTEVKQIPYMPTHHGTAPEAISSENDGKESLVINYDSHSSEDWD